MHGWDRVNVFAVQKPAFAIRFSCCRSVEEALEDTSVEPAAEAEHRYSR